MRKTILLQDELQVEYYPKRPKMQLLVSVPPQEESLKLKIYGKIFLRANTGDTEWSAIWR